MTVVGEGRLSNGSIVRSSNFSNVWFLAADIQGPGMDGREMGVWATNEPGGGGTLFSVNSFAKTFSEWGDGGRTTANLSMADDGAREAWNCARAS